MPSPGFGSDAVFHLATILLSALVVCLFRIVGYDARRVPQYLRAQAAWMTLSVVLVVVAAVALLLAPPPPAGSPCVYTDRVWGPLHMVTSCDSDEFIQVAQHPGRLATRNTPRQQRPLGIMFAALLAVEEAAALGERSHTGWLSYVAINAVTLLCALAIFRRMIAPASTPAVLVVGILGTFLVFNDVVKGFFWSAHTQMWNVLMPIVAIAISLSLLNQPERSWWFSAATGVLLGLGFLAYASFLVCLGAAVISIAAGVWIHRRRMVFGPALVQSVLVAAFAAPALAWLAIVTFAGGRNVMSDVEEFRQFVWMLDAWNEGGLPGLLIRAADMFGEYGNRLWDASWMALVLLAAVLLLGLASPAQLGAVVRTRSRLLLACLITSLVCLVFFGLMGFYRTRLAFNVVVPVVVAAGAIATGLVERQTRLRSVTTVLVVAMTAAGYIASALSRVTWPY